MHSLRHIYKFKMAYKIKNLKTGLKIQKISLYEYYIKEKNVYYFTKISW